MWKRLKVLFLVAVLFLTGISWPQFAKEPASVEAAETYMIYFDSQGGSQVNPITGLTYGSYLSTLPVPTREGYIFEGWYTDLNYTTQFYSYTRIDENKVLFAKWKEKTIISISATYKETTAIKDSLLDKNKITVKAVYSDGTTKILESKDFEVVDLKVGNYGYNLFTVRAGSAMAYFSVQGIQEPLYSVSFYSNGGSYVAPINGIRTDQTISMPAEPAREGYEFKGWYLDNNIFSNQFTSEYKITKSIIVFAKWEKLEVIVEKTEYELNATNLELKVNEEKSLFIESYDEFLEVEYFSENDDIATVSSEGIVEGKAPGIATIYVITPEGKMLECTVAVEGTMAKSIKLNATSKRLKKGKTFQIKMTFSPSNVTSKKLKYTSTNKKIAKVSSTGKVTALKKGTCTIKVQTTDGSGLTKNLKIIVY